MPDQISSPVSVLPKRLVGFRSGTGLPLKAIVFAAIPCPRVERVHNVPKFGSQFRNGPHERPFERRDGLRVPVRHPFFHHFRSWAIVIHPVYPQLGVKLGPETGGEEAIAKQPTRCVQNKNDELRFRDCKSVGSRGLRQPSHHRVHVFDVVDHGSIRLAEV